MWTLSENELVQLRMINQRLKTLQETLLGEAIALDKALQVRLKNPHDCLDDYEIELQIRFYLKEDHPKFKVADENAVTQINEYLKGISKDFQHYPWRWSDNHN
ncbi:MAG: hypothetical protein EOM50_24360, partial [Erysipelotrichia bacterium]|nr:hypothetical protein [Erysipelotrichia bacterium]